MVADELHERLMGWIGTSGRALELRTARTFRARPFVRYANQSVAYEDPETKKQREGDVVAAYRWITDELAVSVEAAVECKAGKSHPWVACYDDHRQVFETPSLWFMPGGTWPDGEQERLMNEWHGEDALVTDRVATHAVCALGSDGKNFVQDARVVVQRVERFNVWLYLGPRVGRRRVYVCSEGALAEMADALEAIPERLGRSASGDDS